MATRAQVVLTCLGSVAALALAEGIARVRGDRLCVQTPGAVYQADPRFGWSHVPGLAGSIANCGGSPVPEVLLDANSRGLFDPERPYAKPPGTVRFLLLGGNLPEGLGVPQSLSLARLLEARADHRLGDRLEVINAGTGGFVLDNDLLFHRFEGKRYAPDLVLVVLDPSAELAALSPELIRASGQRIPAKPFFTFIEGGKLAVAPLRAPPTFFGETPPAPTGYLSRLELYRLALGIPSRTGPPLGWIDPKALGEPETDLAREQGRTVDLARALLTALRDESAEASGRLVAVVAPPRWGGAGAAEGESNERLLADMTAELGIPTVRLGAAFRTFGTSTGHTGYLPATWRWDGEGHLMASYTIWSFLEEKRLLPRGLVTVRTLGGGRVPELTPFPGAVLAALWRSRHGLFSRFVQYGLLAVTLLWAGALLPAAGRDWLVVVVSAAMAALLGTPGLVLAALAVMLAFYGAVERLGPRAGAAAVAALVVLAIVAPVVYLPTLAATQAGTAQFLAVASSMGLLRAIAYARGRRGDSMPLREYLAAMLFFPTFPAGPIESPAEFVARRAPGGVAPVSMAELGAHLRTSARALVRLGWGAFKVVAASMVLNLATPDVFATGGWVFGHARLWLWVVEITAYGYLVLSGLADVAVALGAMAGSRVAENFDAPWTAASPAEFWRRWYGSLGAWLRAHVYLPLGGDRHYAARNVVVVFVVSTLWMFWLGLKLFGPGPYATSGAWVGYVAWGLANAIVVLAGRRWLEPAAASAGGTRRWLLGGVTLALVSLAWMPFFLPPGNGPRDLLRLGARMLWIR